MANAIILNAVEKLRASYWFIPTVMAVLAVILALVLIWMDEVLGSDWPDKVAWIQSNRPDGARALLSTIAGSMITVASVTFSMTISSVSYATSQIGPRLISNFMRDRANQVTLGTFIATFLYCLMVLRTIVGAGEPSDDGIADKAFVPHLAILGAMLFAVASVAVLIFFIHHVPESINVSNIIARVGRDLLKSIETLFPGMIATGSEEVDTGKEEVRTLPDNFFKDATPIRCTINGYIQVLDDSTLMKLAVENDLIFRVEYRPGDFATIGDILLYAYPAQRIDNEIIGTCLASFAFGIQRSQSQDALFLVDEMVEVIARALSSGVNDPLTAISVMDWLQCALEDMAKRQIPDSHRYDEKLNLRLLAHPLNFAMFASAIFDKTLPYTAADRNAALRSMKMLAEVIFKTDNAVYRSLLRQHAENLKIACQTMLKLEIDRLAVQTRLLDIDRALMDPAYLFQLKNGTNWLGGTA